MTEIDTSAEAMRQVLSALREGPNLMFDADVADFIEALAAERDAAVAALAAYRMENGCTRGQRTTQWCSEASALRAAWLRVIQAENSCDVTGRPCDAVRCGCSAEQEMLIREAAEARAALAGGRGDE